MKATLKLMCESCGCEMDLDPESYEKHIKEFHPKKVNVKRIGLNATVWRYLDE